jgi:hypothetical protein
VLLRDVRAPSIQHRALDEITSKYPWYEDLIELIGMRPNKILAGIGNSGDPVDDSVFEPAAPSEQDSGHKDEDNQNSDNR